MSDAPASRVYLAGLAAGLLAGLAMVVALVALRIGAGVSLPTELVADRILPHVPVVRFVRMLDLLGGPLRAKQLAFVGGFLGILATGVALGGLYVFLLRRRGRRFAAVALAGVAGGIWAVSVAALWPVLDASYRGLPPGPATAASVLGLLLAIAVFWLGLLGLFPQLVRAAEPPPELPDGERMGRRTFLLGAGSAALLLAGGGLVELLRRRSALGYDGLTPPRPVQPITPNDRFYVVTKNIVDPRVRKSLWRLEVSGAVEQPREWSFDELAALDSVEQETTLECISNSLGGGLMSNAVWRGVPLAALVEAAGARPEADWVSLGGVDGYEHSLPLARALEPTTLVVYEMNGEPLPDRHGYPARALVPGTYGEVSVKWLEQIVLTRGQDKGYYETQGWEAFEVDTRARIDAPRRSDVVGAGATVRVEGVAFAGARGISRVEVSVDGGDTWNQARITYPGSGLSWSLWRFDWRPAGVGEHELVARAVDGTGTPQPERRTGVVPDGASGYHRVTVRAA